jgi:hypothetical protein
MPRLVAHQEDEQEEVMKLLTQLILAVLRSESPRSEKQGSPGDIGC